MSIYESTVIESEEGAAETPGAAKATERLFGGNPEAATIIFDLDGTLLNDHHQISDATVEAVKMLRNKGFQLVIATGRHFKDIQAFIKQLGGGTAAITTNGASVHNKMGELVYQQCLPVEVNRDLLNFADDFSIHTSVYTKDEWLVHQPRESLLIPHQQSGFFYRQTHRSEIFATDALKLLFNDQRANLQRLKDRIDTRYGPVLHTTFSDEHYLEVMRAGVSKGDAIRILLKSTGLSTANTLAFCDGLNDVELLRTVAHPVVMENADAALLQMFPLASRARSNNEDGVARFLWSRVL